MRQIFDKEKSNPSTAKLSLKGHEFEVVIDPESAKAHRHGEAAINDALLAPHVYRSVQTGELASTELMKELFGTSDEYEVASKIIKDGELHLSDEYKEGLRNAKKGEIIALLAKEAADANTGLPVAEARLHAALAKIHVDVFRSAEEQLPDVVSKLRSMISLTLEKKSVQLRIPPAYAAKLYGLVQSRSKIVDEAWLGDGAFSAKVEISAGLVPKFLDELKSATHGDVEVSVERKK
ncbi:ribosome assembly factor SBDS [Candidatus Woesearchaeota archaeon]|nr:ribosome assembly factor SBDS [Candidatus Woesearchaeota archaeon]